MYGFLSKLIYYLSAVLFGLSTTLAFVCVLARYIFNNSVIWGEEAIRIMFIWMFMFGAAECFRKGKHITLDIVLELWSKPIKKLCKIIIDILLIIFLLFLLYLGIQTSMRNISQGTTALNLSFGIIYLGIPVGAVLMLYFVVHHLVSVIKDKDVEAEKTGTEEVV